MISLEAQVKDSNERNLEVAGSQAYQFLKFLYESGGWGKSKQALQQVFNDDNQQAAEEFGQELDQMAGLTRSW